MISGSLVSRFSLRWLCPLAVLMSLFWTPAATADHHQAKVNRVKAAFIYNIAKFVHWPAQNESQKDLQICFYRKDFIGKGFDSIEGRDVRGKLVVKAVIQDLQHAERCSILLLNSQQLTHYKQAYEASSPTVGLLTVVDLTDSRHRGQSVPGVLLNLVRSGSSIGFEVSLKQVKERQLRMSSQLLKLANILDKGE